MSSDVLKSCLTRKDDLGNTLSFDIVIKITLLDPKKGEFRDSRIEISVRKGPLYQACWINFIPLFHFRRFTSALLYFLVVDGIPILPETMPAPPMDCFQQEVKKLEAIMQFEQLLIQDSLDLWRFLCHYEIPLTRPVLKADIEMSGGIQSKLEDL